MKHMNKKSIFEFIYDILGKNGSNYSIFKILDISNF